MSEGGGRVRPASLRRGLAKGFRAAYDNLGFVVLASVSWFVLLVLCLAAYSGLLGLLGFLPDAVRIVILVPLLFPPWLGLICIHHYAQSTVFREEPTPAEVLDSVRSYLGPAAALFAFDAVITFVLAGDAAILLLAAFQNNTLPLAAGAFIFIYLTVIWLMCAQYHIPMLILQRRSGNQPKPMVVVRESFKITLQNPVFTLGLLAVIIVFAVLCLLPAFAGTVLLFTGAAALVLSEAFREMLISYGLAEDDPEPSGEEKPWSLPEEWRQKQ